MESVGFAPDAVRERVQEVLNSEKKGIVVVVTQGERPMDFANGMGAFGAAHAVIWYGLQILEHGLGEIGPPEEES